MLDISLREEAGGITVITMSGRLDSVSSEQTDATLKTILDRGVVRVVLDMGEVSYINSGGLRSVLATAKRAKAGGGEARIARAQPIVREVLALSGLSQFIALDDDVQSAVAAFG